MNSLPRHFLSCDWGTSSFRLRLVEVASGEVLITQRSADGVQTLARAHAGDAAGRAAAYRALLAQQVRTLLQAPAASGTQPGVVIISGMASSSVGWQELPYAALPVALDGAGLVHAALSPLTPAETGAAAPLPVVLYSGITSGTDIARGEETEALGLLRAPAYAALRADCLLLLPGTHSKHLRVQDGRLVGLQTFMTGELLAVLSQHSLLQHSVAAPGVASADTAAETRACEAELQAGALAGAQPPLSHALFQVRCRQLLAKVPPAHNYHYLAGLLIGAELAALPAATGGAIPVLLAAGERQARSYVLAAQALGLAPRLHLVPPAVVELAAAHGQLACLPHLLAGMRGPAAG